METQMISNEPEARGYGDLLERLTENDTAILVIGDGEEMPWIRSGIAPTVNVVRETRFVDQWPAHAEAGRGAHVWISGIVKKALPPISTASVTLEARR